jgi:hypothetical protein
MDILLAALLMLWGDVSADHPDITAEQLAAASVRLQEAASAESGEPAGVPGGGAGNDQGQTVAGKTDPAPDTPIIRGVYATAHSAGGARLNELVELLNETELNALVIDVKDDWGYVTYESELPIVGELGTGKKIIDMTKLMPVLEENDIYPIARIVVFKDTILANGKPEWSFTRADGTVWKNGRGESFVNPYVKEVWDYNIDVAKEAARLGFKEIQFDYVRFPEGFEKRADELVYERTEDARTKVIADFVAYAREQLNPLGVRVSVDIFGYAASVPAAEGIGQDFVEISRHVDVISPMVYPSHYSTGWFGSKVPDANPYVTINGAMADTHEKLQPLEQSGEKPIIRPWIQDFTATWVPGHIKYGKHEVEEQIRALTDNGIREFLLWNASNKYTKGVDYVKDE